jgi:hypothetical protein
MIGDNYKTFSSLNNLLLLILDDNFLLDHQFVLRMELKMKKIIALLLLFAGFQANAALIDNVSYTTDTISGLDWLDWSITDNQTKSEALSLNAGWREATRVEASNLMDELFGYDVAFGSTLLDEAFQSTYDKAASLFGETCATCASAGVYAMVEGSGLFGARDVSNGGGIYAFDSYLNYGAGGLNSHVAGWALVREVSVSEPSIISLFGMGLLGLGFVRRRRTHN